MRSFTLMRIKLRQINLRLKFSPGFAALAQISSFVLLSFSILSNAPASLSTKNFTTESSVSFPVAASRAPEFCFIPHRLTVSSYPYADLAMEKFLCSLDMGNTAAVCPKTNNTNPGLDFYLPPSGMSIGDFTTGDCKASGAKKIAKYKMSISCSYSPSILAYYHVSRALGDILNVGTAVWRTVDRNRHYDFANWALRLLNEQRTEPLYKYWSEIRQTMLDGEKSPAKGAYLTEEFDQSFGALYATPSGEKADEAYPETGVNGARDFKKHNPIYKALIDSKRFPARDFSPDNLQRMLQLRDAFRMIVLDTVLNQEDRLGNVHYKNRFFYLEPDLNIAGKFKMKSEWKKENIPSVYQSSAIEAKEMLLKDNDCGVNMENRFKKEKLLDEVVHADPQTYRGLLRFSQSLNSKEVEDFFRKELLFTKSDFDSMQSNAKDAANLLNKRCKSGKLKLDLDLSTHFSGEYPFVSCEL